MSTPEESSERWPPAASTDLSCFLSGRWEARTSDEPTRHPRRTRGLISGITPRLHPDFVSALGAAGADESRVMPQPVVLPPGWDWMVDAVFRAEESNPHKTGVSRRNARRNDAEAVRRYNHRR